MLHATPLLMESFVRMDNIFRFLFRTVLLSFFVLTYVAPAIAEDPAAEKERPITLTIESDVVSRYVWYGIASSQGAVWQPAVTVESYGLGVEVWGNFVINNEDSQGKFNELDYTVYYNHAIGKLETQLAVVVYTYPDQPFPSTVQISTHLEYPVKLVSIFCDSFTDVGSYKGSSFFDWGVNFQHDLSPHLSVESSALFGLGTAGFNRAYIADVGTKANLFQFDIALPWELFKSFTFTPHLEVTSLLAGELRDAVDDPTIVSGGVKLGYEF